MFDRGYQDPDEMEVLSGMTEGLLDFAKRYNIAINDPDLIRRYRMIEDGKRDIATRISVAEKKAKEEGLEEGRVEGLETLVTSLKKLLPDFDHVYAAVIENKIYANLTEEQVKKYY